MEDNQFKQDAKSIVDLTFDGKLFKDNVTRDDMNVFEDLISFLLQSRFESYIKTKQLFDKLDKVKHEKNHRND